MGRPKAYAPLEVFLNTRHVGTLRKQSSGAIDFAYGKDWLDWSSAMPVSLSLPLREDRYIGAPVMAVFDNLLPDTDDIRRRVAEKRGAQGVDAFSLLSVVGRDCVGALQFLPEGEEPHALDALTGDALSPDEAASLIANLASAPLGLGEDEDFRISVAGAQEKTALLWCNERWMRPHGTTPTTHILKPQIGTLPIGIDLSNSVENEHLCLRILAAFGLPVADTEIADFGERKVLVVERFDRRHAKDGRLLRLPQEDFCQALGVPPTQKYENEGGPGILPMLDLLKASDTPEEDRLAFLKAQLLFSLLAAPDGHAKNYSIGLRPGGRFQLTPFYDVISVQPAIDAGQLQYQRVKMALCVGDIRHYRLHKMVLRHFEQTAAKAGLPKDSVQKLMDEISGRFEGAWADVEDELPGGFPEALVASIRSGMAKRAGL